MKNVIFKCLAAVVCVLFVSCSGGGASGGGASTPSGAAEKISKAWIKIDAETIVKYLDEEIDPAEREQSLGLLKELLKVDTPVKYKIGNEQISGDGKKATVTVEFFDKDGKGESREIPFVKTSSGWKMEHMNW